MPTPRPILDHCCHAVGLPGSYAEDLERLVLPWLERVVAELPDGRPLLLGINGAQGSGKSTLALILERLCVDCHGLATARLSIDDVYLPLAERQRLASQVHPLLVTRGVPGTHDLALAETVFDRLGRSEVCPMPTFSKAHDDRLPVTGWPSICGPVRIILFEGWCVGCRPEPAERLTDPVNELEAEEDADGRWRAYVNDQLAGAYARLFARLDRLVMLHAPSIAAVHRWRGRQEAALAGTTTGPGLLDAAGLRRFISHFERLTRWQWQDLPAIADARIVLDEDQRMVELVRG